MIPSSFRNRVLAAIAALFTACTPPATDVANSGSSYPKIGELSEAQWLAMFKSKHGSDYDPNSRVDREKMAVLQGDLPTTKKPSDQNGSESIPVDLPPARERILSVAVPLIGQTETQGANRSPIIDKMNRLTGVPLGSPYCASFNAWCYSEAQAPGKWPKSAWSPDWVKNPTWTAAKGGKIPKPADTFGIWFPSKGRVAHTGMIESWGEVSAITVEGNTSPSVEFGSAKDRDGDGIWRKRRFKAEIYAVRNWLDE